MVTMNPSDSWNNHMLELTNADWSLGGRPSVRGNNGMVAAAHPLAANAGAEMLRRGGNVLLLDEPTNDLDVTTLRNLENALLDFNGCVLVISHDRYFLDRICTHLLVFEGENKVRWFEGNFADYTEKRKEELGGREENRRSKYKKLTIR